MTNHLEDTVQWEINLSKLYQYQILVYEQARLAKKGKANVEEMWL